MKIVDVKFKLQGTCIPADHGYHLFSAISKIIPEIHDNEETGVHPVSGQLNGKRLIRLTDKSFLTIRIDAEKIKNILPLAGKTLRIGEHQLTVGVPNTNILIPSARLYSTPDIPAKAWVEICY